MEIIIAAICLGFIVGSSIIYAGLMINRAIQITGDVLWKRFIAYAKERDKDEPE